MMPNKKITTPLEAVDVLKKELDPMTYYLMSSTRENTQNLTKYCFELLDLLTVIETALKRLEEIDTKIIPNMKERFDACNEERIFLRNQRTKFYKENEYLKTELLGQSQELNAKTKALEIIKKKPQTLFLVKTCENYDIYFELAQDTALIEDIYSSKEYDLLKEILK